MRGARRMLWGGLVGGGLWWLGRYFRPAHSTLVLEGKVVIITGASSGIGRSLAFSFARRGARVVLVARRAERLEAVRREIEPYTDAVLVLPADVSQEQDLKQIIDQTLATFGRIDILVNNAGASHGGWLQEQDPERIDHLLRVNLWAAIRLTQLALPHMLQHHHGYVMNIGSGLGRSAAPLFTAYVASKYGLAGFTDALRRELDGSGVRVTLVLPGWTQTDMITPQIAEVAQRYGFTVEHPDFVAERAIMALVHGKQEIVLGGRMSQLGVWLERYAPGVLRWYWRLRLTSEWVDAMRQSGVSDEFNRDSAAGE